MTKPADDTRFEGTRRAESVSPIALDPAHPVLVHMIPQAHIDLAWKWTAADAVEMVLETFRAHADLLEEDATRTFAQGQLAAYAIVEREDPALFARVKALVATGRWEIVGGEWVEPDRAIPSGESLVRQLLEGQRWAAEHLGARAAVAWCPDSFTWHPGNLPQLLTQAGMRFQVLKRPREKFVHISLVPFRWRGIDGTEILTYRTNNKGSGLPLLSEGTPEPPEGASHFAVYAGAFREYGIAHLWGPVGVGDTGGVNTYREPSSGPGWTSRYSTPREYLAVLDEWGGAASLPEMTGPIGPIMTGCLTTHAEMKALNRRAENALQSAEAFVSLAGIHGERIDAGALGPAWRCVLFNQFHDIVTGVGIPEVHVEAAHGFRDVLRGLVRTPKSIPSKYFYDVRGSRLFQQITELEEYYPTRSELEIFQTHADQIAAILPREPFRLVELGAGDGRKTEILLRHFLQRKLQFDYVPIDICKSAVVELTTSLCQKLAGWPLRAHGIVAEYFDALALLARRCVRRNVVLFLGSNIGNFDARRARAAVGSAPWGAQPRRLSDDRLRFEERHRGVVAGLQRRPRRHAGIQFQSAGSHQIANWMGNSIANNSCITRRTTSARDAWKVGSSASQAKRFLSADWIAAFVSSPGKGCSWNAPTNTT